jgi:CheY-like chemotaxis protein
MNGFTMNTPHIHLVVDDSDVNRDLCKLFIKRQDPTSIIVECENGQEAVNKAKELFSTNQQITSIIMDFEMPVMKGDSALSLICKECLNITGKSLLESNIVFHIFTSNEEYECKKFCGSTTCSCSTKIIFKPVAKEKIKELIGKHDN